MYFRVSSPHRNVLVPIKRAKGNPFAPNLRYEANHKWASRNCLRENLKNRCIFLIVAISGTVPVPHD